MIMVFAGANFKSTSGAVLIKIFKFCFHMQIPNSQELFLEKKKIESQIVWSSNDHFQFFTNSLIYR